MCHRNYFTQFSKTVYSTPAPATTPASSATQGQAAAPAVPTSGCETCHGPGKAHADAMLAVQSITHFWIHPLAFMSFLVIGAPLVGLGIMLFLFSLVGTRE